MGTYKEKMEKRQQADELAQTAGDAVADLLQHLDANKHEPWASVIFLAFGQALASCVERCRAHLKAGLEERQTIQ